MDDMEQRYREAYGIELKHGVGCSRQELTGLDKLANGNQVADLSTSIELVTDCIDTLLRLDAMETVDIFEDFYRGEPFRPYRKPKLTFKAKLRNFAIASLKRMIVKVDPEYFDEDE